MVCDISMPELSIPSVCLSLRVCHLHFLKHVVQRQALKSSQSHKLVDGVQDSTSVAFTL